MFRMCQLLIPGMIERLLSETCSMGNMGLNGVYLGLYYRRNFIWVSTSLLLINVNCVWLLLFSIYIFWSYFNKWKKFIF